MRLRWVAGAVLIFVLIATGGPGFAAPAPVSGSGSDGSEIMTDQWRADVATPQYGSLSVSYQGTGSPTGRQQYASGTSDFAVSEQPLSAAQAARRPAAYVPIVVGGLGFRYNLAVGGQRFTALKLRPSTLVKIFTGQITSWSDPKIARDNGRSLPAVTITPVVRSDKSDETHRLTEWMDRIEPGLWRSYCGCTGPTSVYPKPGDGVSQQLSDGVAGYVAGPGGGSIGYVEPAFAKERGFPVASLRNPAGQYVAPTPTAVAAALKRAAIGANGLVDVTATDASTNPNVYPILLVAYAVVPTTTSTSFDDTKGNTLRRFLTYGVCAGQLEASPLGYAPLSSSLVTTALAQIAHIPGSASASCS